MSDETSDNILFNDEKSTPQDRAILMLINRVQELENTVSALEAIALVDSMTIQLSSIDVSNFFKTLMGQTKTSARDWSAFVAEYGNAINKLGVDVSEVVVYGDKDDDIFAPLLQGLGGNMTTLTVRFNTRQDAKVIEIKLYQALRNVKTIGDWRTTDLFTARNGKPTGSMWMWQASNANTTSPAPISDMQCLAAFLLAAGLNVQ